MPTAYSYLRFSSPQQATGDSVRRQTQSRQKWLAAHPRVQLDHSLVLTDAGRSAFKRKDWGTYALARFVEHIKSGRVAPGSYLLVENLDRVSRENAGEATELFLSIVNKGIVIVQLSPVVIEFSRPVDMPNLMFAVMELSRGHSESAMKSERGRAFWARKQREAATRLVTKRLPGWIRLKGERLVLDATHGNTIRRMFMLAKEGLGTTAIAKKLNAEGVPMMGKKAIAARGQTHLSPEKRVLRSVVWSGSLVWHFLTSRATIGEYVPYRRRGAEARPAIPNYFPAVIDADTYHSVRNGIASRGKTGRGRHGKRVNLFTGLLKDAQDGGSLSYWNNGGHPPVLISVNAKEGKGAKWVSFPAGPFEDAITLKLTEVKAADLQGGKQEVAKAEVIAGRIAELDSLIKLWTAKMDNPAIVETVATKLAELHTERKKLSVNLSDAQREASSPVAESWGEFRTLADLLKKDTSNELRMRVRSVLRQAIERVTCLFVTRGRTRLAAVRVDFAGERGHRDYLIRHKMAFNNGSHSRPAILNVQSFAEAEVGKSIDIRKPADAAKVERLLARLKLSE